jgi:hypothetical protein
MALVVFASLAMVWQLCHWQEKDDPGYTSVIQAAIQTEQLAKIPAIMGREYRILFVSGAARYLDLSLPAEARVFMPEMTGPTNYSKIMYYYYLTYYLFPREVGTSLDHVTRLTKNGFVGNTSTADEEIRTNGFDVRIDITPDAVMHPKALRDLTIRNLANPPWFDSVFDGVIAGLLPGLTALAGMWLFRLLFPTLTPSLPLVEQWAYGLGLGMMAVAAGTLGLKLCGFHGDHWIGLAAGAGAAAEIGWHRKTYGAELMRGLRQLRLHPAGLALLAVATLVFLILFRLAGLQGLVDYDAVMAWSLKAKILHLSAGSELVQWFSNPRLAHAHLDYPTLVPALHAATYDSLGHVNEFVTKFWPAWMLLLLLAALAALYRGGRQRFYAPYFGLLTLLLLPAIQRYVQFEGGTLPTIFFTVLGFGQLALWFSDQNRARLGLGLILLSGAAMAKYEGFIFLALAGGWLLALPAARRALKRSADLWPVLGFGLLAALPFVCLRMQIPILQYESGWAGYALHHPGTTLFNSPRIFLILVSQWFVSYDFANWSAAGGQLHWIGRWDGLSSLYHHPTLGLAWICLLMTVALWFAVPARRTFILWLLAVMASIVAAFSVVFASFVDVTGLNQVMGYATEQCAGRYLLPILMAWFAAVSTLFFREEPAGETVSDSAVTAPPGGTADSGSSEK